MKKIIIAIIIIGVIGLGGYYITQYGQNINKENSDEVNIDSSVKNTESIPEPVQVENNHEVEYSDDGFLPKELSIKVGDAVIFKNQSSQVMWVGSAMHPTHIVYSGTSLQEHCPDTENISFDQCESSPPSTLWSFTFNKPGTWGYHNHSNAQHFGKIIVE